MAIIGCMCACVLDVLQFITKEATHWIEQSDLEYV